MVIEGLDDLYEPFFYVESSEDMPEAIIPYPIECFLEVNEIVKQVPLVLPSMEGRSVCSHEVSGWIS